MDREFIDQSTLAEPRLYIIMRKDMYQMNPGKGMAQAAHAATKFVLAADRGTDNKKQSQLDIWAGTRGFGTKIILEATLTEMNETLAKMHKHGVRAALVTDPTYPYSNHYGEFYTAEEVTCMYVFAEQNIPQEALDYIRQFRLHP